MLKIVNIKYVLLFLLVPAYFACGKKQTSPNNDTEWFNKNNLTKKEIIDSVLSDIENAKAFKYTSANSANVNFYGGQKTNTFLLDKKGNAFSSRNREQNFRIDGKVYTRKIGLKEEGLIATVISDILDKSTSDEDYFNRNIPYVKENGITNIKMLEDCEITTSVSGNTLTVKTTDFEKLDNPDKKFIKDLTVTYTPHKEIINKITFVKDGETIIRTYSYFFNPDEEVKLPQVMKTGTKLTPVK